MERGNLLVLAQPAELVIIGGAAIGTVLIGNPPYILKKLEGGVLGSFGGSQFTEKRYLDSLKMLCDLFNLARRGGLSAIESDIEDPSKSKVFTQHSSCHLEPHPLLRDRVPATGGQISCQTAEDLAVSREIAPADRRIRTPIARQ